MSTSSYQEPVEELSAEARDMHRAIVSLMEELDAIDSYNQRAALCKDAELKKIWFTTATKRKNMRPCCWSGSDAMTQSFPTS